MWNASYPYQVTIRTGELSLTHRFSQVEFGHAVALYVETLLAGMPVEINFPIVETSSL